MTEDIPELTSEDFESAIRRSVRNRLLIGQIEGKDVESLRKFVRLEKGPFARALRVSLDLLDQWEAGLSRPEGPVVSLLRIAAKSPSTFRWLLSHSATK